MTDQPSPLRPRAERCPEPDCTDAQQCWRCDYEESQHATAVAAAKGYCPHCGRGDAGPTADEYEASQRRAIRIQTLLDEQRDRARKDAVAGRESERILQQQIDRQAKEIDRLRDTNRRARQLADQWFVAGPTAMHIQAGKEFFAALDQPKETPDA